MLPNEDLVETWHCFGEAGPTYQVVGVEDGEMVRIVVLHSNETLSYPASEVRADPHPDDVRPAGLALIRPAQSSSAHESSAF